MTTRGKPDKIAILLVLLAAAGFGFIPYFVRQLAAEGLNTETTVLIRFGIPAVMLSFLLPQVIAAGWAGYRLVLAGMFMGLGAFAYFRGIERLDIALAATIFFTFPFFAMAYRLLLLGERTTPRQLIAAGLAFTAILVITRPGAITPADAGPIAFTFIGPAAYGALIVVLARTPAQLSTAAVAAGIFAGTAIGILPFFAFGETGRWLPASFLGWRAFFGMMVISGIVSQILMTIGARRAGAGPAAIAATFELPVALAAGWLLVGEPMQGFQLIGAAMILLAILIASTQ